MKRILGLDLGTNSIGWALINAEVNENDQYKLVGIEASGSRIIPMDAAILGEFDKGNSISQTAERTRLRGVRRLRERNLLRRERLNRVLNLLDFLPSHYSDSLNRYGQIKDNIEPKLAWKKNEIGEYEFLFTDSFNEMLQEFHTHHPELNNQKIPYDWTIYYLRKKALTQKISKEELAWLLLNFNQKRGYYQLRGEEDEETATKQVEYHILKVIRVEDSGEKKGKDTWYNVHLENGWIYRRPSSTPLDWVGKSKEFIVTTDLNEDGTPKKDKEGNIKRSFRAPKEDDWSLIKERTQADINSSGKTVGAYIYDTLLLNPSQKINGKLVRTIERKFYKEELIQILKKQVELHPELQDELLYDKCIEALYPSNDAYKNNIKHRDFIYLFVEDILFYQRPLKTKKHLISNCPYETRKGLDKNKLNIQSYPIKCIAKSHPLYQEFRLWQFISNLRIYKKGLANDIDVTKEFIKSEEDIVALYEWLNNRKAINQKALLKYPAFGIKKGHENYRWNYVEDKDYPCNETRAILLNSLQKVGIDQDFLNDKKEESLWQILYSIDDKIELTKALNKFASKYELSIAFVESFSKLPPFKKEYGAYSAKAIKKLLPLMRVGKYWDENNIDAETLNRINKITSGEYDENIKNRVREKTINLSKTSDFKGLPLWLACYVVYDRHSEAKEITKWESPEDLNAYLSSFKQHSLRNPIVEQIITETLRTVRDIWKKYDCIDEIHVELGREMKNPADKRGQITKQVLENENTNLRIKALLMEFNNPDFEIENVRPYSPNQQEILRIYEEGVLSRDDVFKTDNANDYKYIDENEKIDIESIIKKFKESDSAKRPTKAEIIRYKLWLEQKYRSPYTGQPISLSKLFTNAYEIEHIIPQSRYFDDSYSNKVICESEVNKLKDNLLGYEFIKKHSGEKVELSFGKSVTIFTNEEYEKFVKEHYGQNRTKMRKLMMEDIPDDFISRQLNDSRYISKVIKNLLSNIVREDNEEEAISKNVIVCTGGVTDRLKKDWGLNDVWNKIILPRFERLNDVANKDKKKEDTKISFTCKTENGHIIPYMPLELQKGFNRKRIDHRHHAMDAIVIACASRNIVNYLNNESAHSKSSFSRYDLQRLLCTKTKTDDKGNYKWVLNKPWDSFTEDVYTILNKIIISFKQNLRVIKKSQNRYSIFDNQSKKKIIVNQIINDPKTGKTKAFSILKPLHKDGLNGLVHLAQITEISVLSDNIINNPSNIASKDIINKIYELKQDGYTNDNIRKFFKENITEYQGIKIDKKKDIKVVCKYINNTNEKFYATRKELDSSFDAIKILTKITDTAIQNILLEYLKSQENNPTKAFSQDGIDFLNDNIKLYNNGKYHKPIKKVRIYEKSDKKFPVGVRGNKSKQFVEAADNTNLFFAVYEKNTKNKTSGNSIIKRDYDTIPLSIVINRLKQGLQPVPEKEGKSLIFVLSPNDLVYIPKNEETEKELTCDNIDYNRIYKFVSCTGNVADFIPVSIARPILDTTELGSNNKAQRAWTNEMIKEICIPIKVDRLGNIIKIGY